LKKKFLVGAVMAGAVLLTFAGFCGIMKMARASNQVQAEAATADKGANDTIVETMRSCLVTVSTQGLTDAGVNQAYRLCWNRSELVGKKHKEK
jgi:outer membrane murein-binding lipoprotein Lpp